MWYDLSDALERETFRLRCRQLESRPCMVELTEHRPRTLSANAYLHAIISWLALQVGVRAYYAKEQYYKRAANSDVFVVAKVDPVTGFTVETLRSTAELDEAALSLTIERFRTWSAEVAGVYLPSGEEHIALQRIQHDVDRAKKWL